MEHNLSKYPTSLEQDLEILSKEHTNVPNLALEYRIAEKRQLMLLSKCIG
jgi:hypothetical protein